MSFLIDTDVCSAYLKGNGKVFNKFIQHSGGLYVSTVVVGELYTWVHRVAGKPERLEGLLDLLAETVVLPFDLQTAEHFGKMRADLINQGIIIPHSDMQIASTASMHNLTVVTHNTRHFALLSGLRIEDWLL